MEFHGGAKDEKLIDFSISVNPYLPEWKDALFSKCAKFSTRYLYNEWIEDEFRKKFGQDATLLAGSTEAFQIIGLTLMNGANVVIPTPSYGEYERVANYMAKKVIKVLPKNEINLDLDLAFEISKKFKKQGEKVVLIFGNPNNPTGNFLNVKDEILKLAESGVIIILDEAFIDFLGKSVDNFSHPGLIKVRTFTKSYGMPGIRLGYALSDNFKSLFEKYRSPWAIGTCGYVLTEFILNDDETFLKESIGKIKCEYKKFEKSGIKTDVNFGILKVEDGDEFQRTLDKYGIHVRNCKSFGLANHVRLSIKKPEENDILFEALKKVNLKMEGDG